MKAVRALIWLALLGILVGLVGFVVQNPSQRVDVHVYQTTYVDVPLVLALFIAFLAGLVLTLVFGSYFVLEQSLGIRRVRLEKRALERELDALRNLAVEDSAIPGGRPTGGPARVPAGMPVPAGAPVLPPATGASVVAPAAGSRREEPNTVWERL